MKNTDSKTKKGKNSENLEGNNNQGVDNDQLGENIYEEFKDEEENGTLKNWDKDKDSK